MLSDLTADVADVAENSNAFAALAAAAVTLLRARVTGQQSRPTTG